MPLVVICGVILLSGIIKISLDKNKIDIVYTWVENTEEFQKEKQYWLSKETKNLNNEIIRYIDNEELRYSLRSIEKYFPNYNKIYLLVKDDQFPKYLKETHPKLKVIKHSDIIPKEYLPTFNSMAIECYLHHIPGLNKNYIYMNDDVLFLYPTEQSYFLKNNKPIPLVSSPKHKFIQVKDLDYNNYNYIDGCVLNNYILDNITNKYEEKGRNQVSHIPKMFNRDYDYYIENVLKSHYMENSNINLYDSTAMSKFRKTTNLYLVALLKEYLYNYFFQRDFKQTSCLYIENDNNNDKLLKELNTNKRFMCIQSVGSNNKYRYYSFMDNLFPNKSSFEI